MLKIYFVLCFCAMAFFSSVRVPEPLLSLVLLGLISPGERWQGTKTKHKHLPHETLDPRGSSQTPRVPHRPLGLLTDPQGSSLPGPPGFLMGPQGSSRTPGIPHGLQGYIMDKICVWCHAECCALQLTAHCRGVPPMLRVLCAAL